MEKNTEMNQILNSNLMELLSTIDKNKLEKVTRMVQNMSSDDLNNLVNMLKNSQNGK